ncbi:MAG: AraC family transcriptional regulator [Polyangiales bacterium]
MATIAISLVRAIVDELERQGVEPTVLLEEAGIEPWWLDDPQIRIDVATWDRLQRIALERSGDPAFGLHMGEHASSAAFSVLGHMVAQCRTIREALEVLFQYYRLVADVAPPYMVEHGDVVQIVYTFVRTDDALCNRLRAEFGMTRLLAIARIFLGSEATPEEAWFEHPQPAYGAEYTRIFRGTERFGRVCTGFLVKRALLEQRQLYHDETLYLALKEQADRSLERIAGGEVLAPRIVRLIVDGHPEVQPEMGSVARRLGMSERSLRRRLKSEGASFPDLVREAMSELARRLLREPSSSIQETAYRLGFSDVSSFHRAFKRWTGTTPSEFRRTGS